MGINFCERSPILCAGIVFFLGMKFGGVWVNVVNLYSTIIFEEEVMNFTK